VKHAQMVASGTVQGVAFRYQTSMIARKLGLTGHVKNLDDGTVEIVCEGGQDAIDALIESIRVLAPPIEVRDVQTTYSDAKGLTKFEIIAGDLAQEMVAGFGTGAAYINKMLEKQDKTLDEIRSVGERQDKTLDEIRSVGERQDKTLDVIHGLVKNQARVLERQDETAAAVRDLHRRLRA